MVSKVFNVPNILSIFRLALIPVFVLVYFKNDMVDHYFWAMLIVIVAGVTDIADGYIARKYNLITPVGKILDPMADKLMQATVLVCIALRQPLVIPMAAIHILKELIMLVGGVWFFRRQKRPYSSRWWGKLSTVIIILSLVLIIFSDVTPYVPRGAIVACIVLSIISMLFALVSYVVYGIKIKNSCCEEK